MIIASQIRAARGIVGIGQKELADLAGVSVATLRRMESDNIGPEKSAAGVVESVKNVLIEKGAQFLNPGDTSPGHGVSIKD